MALQDALEWCDQNMHNNYPLVDSAQGISTSGVVLPSSFLVDFQLIVPHLFEPDCASRFYISSIIRNASSFQIELSYFLSADEPIVCAKSEEISIDLRNTSTIEDRTIALFPVSNYQGLNHLLGYFIIGSCVDMQNIGSLQFTHSNANLLSLRVYITDIELSNITIQTSNDDKIKISEDFIIRAGDGIGLSLTEEYNEELNVNMPILNIFRVPTIAESESKYQSIQDVIVGTKEALGEPILRINGIAPDRNGNFTVTDGDCVNIKNNSNGITINNPCSQPCCSENSIEDVQNAISLLEQAQERLQSSYESMAININAIQARLSSLIAAKQ